MFSSRTLGIWLFKKKKTQCQLQKLLLWFYVYRARPFPLHVLFCLHVSLDIKGAFHGIQESRQTYYTWKKQQFVGTHPQNVTSFHLTSTCRAHHPRVSGILTSPSALLILPSPSRVDPLMPPTASFSAHMCFWRLDIQWIVASFQWREFCPVCFNIYPPQAFFLADFSHQHGVCWETTTSRGGNVGEEGGRDLRAFIGCK